MKHSTVPTAVTVEERGSSPMRARSPKNAPSPSVVSSLRNILFKFIGVSVSVCQKEEITRRETKRICAHRSLFVTQTWPDFIM